MRLYWLWLLFNVIIWSFAFVYFNQNIEELTVRLFGVALYFVFFFTLPLIERKPKILLLFLIISTIIAVITLFPDENEGFNPYLILVLTLLIGKGFSSLSLGYSMILGVIIALGLRIPMLKITLPPLIQIFITIYLVLLFTAMILYKKTKDNNYDLHARYHALLSEYT